MIGDEEWSQEVTRHMMLGALMFQCMQIGIDRDRVRRAYEEGSIFDAYETAGYLWAEKQHRDAANALREQEGI